MKAFHSSRFKRSFNGFPSDIQQKVKKQIINLLRDIRHPSLRAKKYDESRGIWQARVDRTIRFYFLIEGDTYVLLYIKYHPK